MAFQGEFGAWSEWAVRRACGAAAEPLPCRTLREVFDAIEAGRADLGVVPVENSRAGSVVDTYDLLLQRTLAVRGEVAIPIEQCLLAPPGARLEDVRRVYSHPQALAQCEAYLRRLGAETIAVYGALPWVLPWISAQVDSGTPIGRMISWAAWHLYVSPRWRLWWVLTLLVFLPLADLFSTLIVLPIPILNVSPSVIIGMIWWLVVLPLPWRRARAAKAAALEDEIEREMRAKLAAQEAVAAAAPDRPQPRTGSTSWRD